MENKTRNKNLEDEFRQHFKTWLEIENIEGCVEEYQFCKTRKFRFDFAFPEKKIGIDLHGMTHFRHEGQIKKDAEKAIEAQVQGWKYFVFPSNYRYYEPIKELIQ